MTNYNEIENLSEEQILELFDNSILVAEIGTHYLYVECNNGGYRGYCYSCGYNTSSSDAGISWYTTNTTQYWDVWFCCPREGGGRFYRNAYTRSFSNCDPLVRYK